MTAAEASRLVSGRYPAPGASSVADAIRIRRGERGLTPLDATLLHVPPIAAGWNSLLGAVRTQGKLPGDIRELMVSPPLIHCHHVIQSPCKILRVAALNHAAFEWIQHEHVGRECGLTNAQLYVLRDTATPLPPSTGIFSDLQTSALMFADASTRNVQVEKEIADALMNSLRTWVAQKSNPGEVEETTQDLLVEAAAVTATYNMVSRFLVSLDVACMSDNEVPWPVDRKEVR
jgi:hypothetical protein